MKYTFIAKDFMSSNIKANTTDEAFEKLLEKYTLNDMFYVVNPKSKYKNIWSGYEQRMIEKAAKEIERQYKEVNSDEAKLIAGIYFCNWVEDYINYVLEHYDEDSKK